MAKYDLTPKIGPYLDCHLVFPLLESLHERQIYPDESILKAKIQLLNKTNMVDYAMDIHKSLYRTDDVPQDMVERRAEVVGRLKALEESAAPLIAFLQNANAVQELRADKQYNLQMLSERYQIGPDQIEALYLYAKFQFECGNYSGAADYLYQYRALCTNPDRSLNALWGKLAAEILMQNWDIALEELNRLKEIIDSKNFASPLNQVQCRIWLMHWSLFIFFNHDNGRTLIIDLFNQDKYLNAIQTNAPHLLRYLAIAFIVNKRRRPQFKDFIKIIQQEQSSFKDPITEFLACVFVNYDFDTAQKKMTECEDTMCMVTSVKPCVLCSYGSLRIGLQGYSGKVQMEGTIHHVSVNQHKLKSKIVPGAIFVLQTMCFQRYPLKNVGYFRLVPQNVVMFIGIGGEIQNSNSTHWPRMNKVEQDQGSSMLEQGQGSTIPDSWQQAFNLGYQDMEEYVNFSDISELHETRLETTFPLTMCMVTRVRPYSLCSYGSLRIGLEGYNRKGQMDGVIDYVAVNTHKLKGKIVPGSLFVLQSMCFRSFPSYPIDSFSIQPHNIVLFIGNGGEIHK